MIKTPEATKTIVTTNKHQEIEVYYRSLQEDLLTSNDNFSVKKSW